MKYTDEVLYVAKEMARSLVKQAAKEAGVKINTVSSKQVNIAANALLAVRPEIFRTAKRRLRRSK